MSRRGNRQRSRNGRDSMKYERVIARGRPRHRRAVRTGDAERRQHVRRSPRRTRSRPRSTRRAPGRARARRAGPLPREPGDHQAGDARRRGRGPRAAGDAARRRRARSRATDVVPGICIHGVRSTPNGNVLTYRRPTSASRASRCGASATDGVFAIGVVALRRARRARLADNAGYGIFALHSKQRALPRLVLVLQRRRRLLRG